VRADESNRARAEASAGGRVMPAQVTKLADQRHLSLRNLPGVQVSDRFGLEILSDSRFQQGTDIQSALRGESPELLLNRAGQFDRHSP
jgi:hypothetical protein